MNNMSLDHTLRPGGYLQFEEQTYRIETYDAHTLEIHVQHLVTSEVRSFHLQELLEDDEICFAPTLEALLKAAAVPVPPLPVEDELPAALLTQADHIIRVVETVEQMVATEAQRALRQTVPFRRTRALQRALAQLDPPVALSTFYKYRRQYQAAAGVRTQLAASLHRSTYNQTRATNAQLHFVDTLIVRYYARQRPLRPMTLYRLGQSVLERTGNRWIDARQAVPEDLVEELLDPRLPIDTLLDNPEKATCLTTVKMPSRGWFYQYLRWFESQPDAGEAVVTARYGTDAWDRQHRVFDTFVSRAAFPLHYVFADHWLLDIFTVDEITRSQRHRLWLTLLIDAYSRSVLGLALLYEPPSIMSIQRALHHAIWPKTSHTTLGIEATWACFGIPQQLSLDNAWAHHSHSLEQLARAISQHGQYNSIDLMFRPPYRGRYGALIERLFGNLSAQIKEHLPGAILSSSAKHLHQAAQQACLVYHDVNRFLHQIILVYQHSPHAELNGGTPHQVWCDGLAGGLPLVPPQTPEMMRLFWRLDPKPRVLTSKGINAFGMQYWSSELGRLAQVGRDGQRVRYHLRYDPIDISQVALFREGIWVGDAAARQLRQPDGTTRPVSLLERELAKALARDQHVSLIHWLDFVDEIDTLTRTRQVEKRRAQRQPTPPPEPAQSPVDDVAQHYTDLLARFMSGSKESQS